MKLKTAVMLGLIGTLLGLILPIVGGDMYWDFHYGLFVRLGHIITNATLFLFFFTLYKKQKQQ